MPGFIADKQEKVKRPDIRINAEGQVIIDYKTEISNRKQENNNRIVSIDYGLRKLLTITCFEMNIENLRGLNGKKFAGRLNRKILHENFFKFRLKVQQVLVIYQNLPAPLLPLGNF